MQTQRTEITGMTENGRMARLVDGNGQTLYVGDVIETPTGDIHRLIGSTIKPNDWQVITNWGIYWPSDLGCSWAR